MANNTNNYNELSHDEIEFELETRINDLVFDNYELQQEIKKLQAELKLAKAKSDYFAELLIIAEDVN